MASFPETAYVCSTTGTTGDLYLTLRLMICFVPPSFGCSIHHEKNKTNVTCGTIAQSGYSSVFHESDTTQAPVTFCSNYAINWLQMDVQWGSFHAKVPCDGPF